MKKKTTRQAVWAKGKAHLILLNEPQVKKIGVAIKNGIGSTDQYKSTKSRVIRYLIDKHL